MLTPVRSGQFRRDVKRAERQGRSLGKLKDVVMLLLSETPLPARYKDHPLRGNWKGFRDAHIEPDWLLIYRIDGDELQLARIGSHSELFSE